MNRQPRGCFVTGTDTGVGKTAVAAALVRLAASRRWRAAGFKPVASGSRPDASGHLRNDDALELRDASSVALEYEEVNPWCFAPAIAPHLAARDAGATISGTNLVEAYRHLATRADWIVVEGAGGWRVPLHPAGFLSDLPESLSLEVVLVVGLRLGCLNHARLTAEAIRAGGRCRWLGWIANAVDPVFERSEDNVETLSRLLGDPPLACVPWRGSAPRSRHGHVVVDFSSEVRLIEALRLEAPV